MENELKERIKTLETELKKIKHQNQMKKLKSLKLNHFYLKKIAPYFLASSLGVCCAISLMGLRKTNFAEKFYVERTIDNQGNDKTVDWYEIHGEVKPSLLYYYDKYQWIENEKEYQRNLKIYSLSKLENLNTEELLNITEENFDNLLGKPIAKKVEHAKTITEEEKNWNNLIELKLYSTDPEKMIPYEITIKDYIEPTMLLTYVLILLLFNYFASRFIGEEKKENYQLYKEEILKELHLEDENGMKEELKLLRSKLGE